MATLFIKSSQISSEVKYSKRIIYNEREKSLCVEAKGFFTVRERKLDSYEAFCFDNSVL